jgi:hypothetical protein
METKFTSNLTGVLDGGNSVKKQSFEIIWLSEIWKGDLYNEYEKQNGI